MNLVLHEKYNVRWQCYFRLSKCVRLSWTLVVLKKVFYLVSLVSLIEKNFIYSKQYILILYVIAKFTNRNMVILILRVIYLYYMIFEQRMIKSRLLIYINAYKDISIFSLYYLSSHCQLAILRIYISRWNMLMFGTSELPQKFLSELELGFGSQ